MFVRVDEDTTACSGFCYKNMCGSIENVVVGSGYVYFTDECGDNINAVYYEDIPKMIKALQAAYDYKKGQK